MWDVNLLVLEHLAAMPFGMAIRYGLNPCFCRGSNEKWAVSEYCIASRDLSSVNPEALEFDSLQMTISTTLQVSNAPELTLPRAQYVHGSVALES